MACATVLVVACKSADSTDAADSGSDGADNLSFGPGAPTFDPLEPSDASLPLRAATLFGTTCRGGPESGCHGMGAAGLHLVLSRDGGGDIVDVPSTERPALVRVKPRDPASSYLFLKVAGDGGIDGDVMPAGTRRDPRIPALIGDWIAAGAEAP